MLILKLVLQAWIAPAVVCAVTFWLVRRLAGGRVRSSATSSVSLAAGYLAGQVLSIGVPPFPPVESTQWLFVLACLSVLPGLFGPGILRWGLAGIVGAVLLSVTLAPMIRYHWTTGEAAVWIGGVFAILTALWCLLDSLASREDSGTLLLSTFLVVGLGSAVLMALSATTLLAHLATVMVAGLSALFVSSLRFRVSARGWLPVALTVLAGLALNGHLYARLSGWNVLWLTSALLSAWFVRVRWLQARPPWQRITITLVPVVIITALAVAGAGYEFLANAEYEDY